MNAPIISLICSTIGRPSDLRRQLDALLVADQVEHVEFILIDQSTDQQCTALLAEYSFPGTAKAITSGRGLSVGRNAGLRLATAPIVAFPDDNCWYGTDTISAATAILARRPELSGVSGRQVTEDGQPSMLRWLTRETVVTRTNFMRTTISSTLFLRRDALPSETPFDESIGAGSPGWHGSGEESDVLLRMLAAGHTVLYRPDIPIYQDDDRSAADDAYVAKMLRYGGGTGHLWRRHRLSIPQLAYHSARKLAGSVVRAASGDRDHARADLAYLRGQLAGYRGVKP